MITTWTFATSGPQVATLLLKERSTNLSHLSHDPVRVLALSAFWLGGRYFFPCALAFVFLLAPAEYWLGTGRTVATFLVGHVGATLLTAGGLIAAIKWGFETRHVAREIDVGVSYGFMCVAALFTYRLPRPWRYWWAVAIVVVLAVGVAFDGTVTDVGHLVAAALGFALYPITRSASVQARAAEPLYSVTVATGGVSRPTERS